MSVVDDLSIEQQFLATMRQYRDEGVVYVSPMKGSPYYITDVDESGCVAHRIRAGTTVRCTAEKVKEFHASLKAAGGEGEWVKLIPGNRILRTTVLQAPWAVLDGDRKTVVDASNPDRVIAAFESCIREMDDGRSPDDSRLYKPAMLATVVELIGQGAISENRITLDAIAEPYRQKMAQLGVNVSRHQVVSTLFHLSSKPYWTLCYVEPERALSPKEFSETEFRSRVRHAKLKEPFWSVLQTESARRRILDCIANTWWPGEAGQHPMKINRALLERAVAQTIRPWLIDQGNLYNRREEGWHHQSVLPKAGPLLARAALAQDPVGNLRQVINAAQYLLSQFEHTRAGEFLAQVDPATLRDRTIDLLYGDDPLKERLNRFVEWATAKNAAGKPIGFNHTAVSYLLACSDPRKYAFCKPSIHQAAAAALLGGAADVKNQADRVVHAAEFYKEALVILRELGLPFEDLMHVHIAFYVVEKGAGGLPDWKKLVSEPSKPPRLDSVDIPLNLILYGPPGTGKTYDVVRRAVKICDGAFPADERQINARFRQLREEGRIELVTFHQSFGYEEFVEGIRPQVSGDGEEGESSSNGHIRYSCCDGVFKRICELAGAGSEARAHQSVDLDLDNTTVWKMSLGNTLKNTGSVVYEDCIDNGYALLGWGGAVDYAGCDDRVAIRRRARENGKEMTEAEASFVNRFKNEMEHGELVVVSDGNTKFRAVGRVTGGYQFSPDTEYHHKRPVEWLLVCDTSLPVEKIYRKILSQQTIYKLGAKFLKVDGLKALLKSDGKAGNQPHVLIIDEINRANVSKVFGELITLLEPDKRKGATNDLRVTLPYSGETFGVPSNLYVLGTMNTADRSIALIDTALRRRFRFEELMPDSAIIRQLVGDNGQIGEVDIAELFEVINGRIELLFDRDHQLGHSYFLQVRSLVDLRNVFTADVIPMLQEYFYGDWNRVATVLGCAFDSDTGILEGKNDYPILATQIIDGAHGIGDLTNGASAVRCRVNPKFMEADETELAEFFNGIAQVAPEATV